jgi:hypothetical protein
MAELFGFRIERPKKAEGSVPSFTTPTADDGTLDIAGGGFFGQILDTDGRERTDLEARQVLANNYDTRTANLGNQLRNPWNKEYGQRQQNPYLNMGIQGMMGL